VKKLVDNSRQVLRGLHFDRQYRGGHGGSLPAKSEIFKNKQGVHYSPPGGTTTARKPRNNCAIGACQEF
jgi:hypothetical protein